MKNNYWVYGIATYVLLAAAVLTESSVIFAASPAANSPGIEISIDNFSFTPAAVTVKTGTRITWTNRDDFSAHGGKY